MRNVVCNALREPVSEENAAAFSDSRSAYLRSMVKCSFEYFIISSEIAIFFIDFAGYVKGKQRENDVDGFFYPEIRILCLCYDNSAE